MGKFKWVSVGACKPGNACEGSSGCVFWASLGDCGVAFKLMIEVLQGKRLETHNVEYPPPWVPGDQVKVCAGDKPENGCNAFPAGKVPDSFVTEIFNPDFCRSCRSVLRFRVDRRRAVHSALTGRWHHGNSEPAGDQLPIMYEAADAYG
ncbi:hypothetical protein E2553_35465 [Paraburkholderia dipogonis]|uniref:Uncharacterized protein n=1 Tax=Paraburkholderia dipogonis TaxID=1211383 RepID=A0A4Y8MWM8_9BURK|nr:hypothetical protein [Paraburkholderia dipogonis]TFE41927.1 hypothetical protein E2553_35465 [Paraburkholderia dipogonis]